MTKRSMLPMAALAAITMGCVNPSSLPYTQRSDLATHLSFGPSGGVQALAAKLDADWTQHTIVSRYLSQTYASRASQRKSYHLNAFPTAQWSKGFSVASQGRLTNTPAFSPYDPAYSTSLGPNDRLLTMTNRAKGGNNFFVQSPSTGAITNNGGSGWDALTIVGAPNGAQVDGSSLTVSNAGTFGMFVTTGAYFGCINTRTGAKVAGIQLGSGQRCVNSAPWVDYSANGDTEGKLSVWCATTNAAGTTGQLYHINGNATWTASAVTVSGPAADGSAGTVTAAGFKTSPVAWNDKVYIGDTSGKLWEYTISTNKSQYWDLASFSGLVTDQIIAPVAIDLGPGDKTDKVFVSCGNRVFWIDPVTDTVTPSPLLLTDTATATPGKNLQGSLDDLTFDSTSTVANIFAKDTASVVGNVVDNLNNQEVTGSDSYSFLGDGQPCNGYIRFDIAANAFGGKLPVSAKLTMCTDDFYVPNASDAGSMYRASKYLSNGSGADSGTLWTYNNMSKAKEPRLIVPTSFSSAKGPTVPYKAVTWNISGAIPNDNAIYTFCLRGKNKTYSGNAGSNDTSAGYYGATASHTIRANRAWAPYLTVTTSNYGLTGAVQSQPIINDDGTTKKLYAVNANALFEMDYSDAGSFGNTSKTYFSLLKGGRTGAGNLGVVVGSKFVQNYVSLAISIVGGQYYAYVGDEGGLTGTPHMCKFSLPLNEAANSDSLLGSFSLPAATAHSCPFIPYDYFDGSLYFTDLGLTTSTMYRVPE